jgi:glycosyl-4,4'-diaponeurosporenoate acyltransferase
MERRRRMRILELPVVFTVLIDFVAWFIIHIGCAIITLNLPDRFFQHEGYIYRSRDWERSGKIWQTHFRVRAWKDKLPDGATLFGKGFSKKKLQSKDPTFLTTFIQETRRAELTHWIAMPPALLFFLWNPPPVGWIMIVYALLVNAPCIIAQRYNRTRLQRVVNKAGQGACRRRKAGN